MNQMNVDNNSNDKKNEDKLLKALEKEEQEYLEYINESIKDEVEYSKLENAHDDNDTIKKDFNFFIKFIHIIIKAKNKSLYFITIGFILTFLDLIYNIVCYVNGIITLKYDAVPLYLSYYIFFLIFSFSIWIYSTCFYQFNFKLIKLGTFVLCILNFLSMLLNISYLGTCIFLMPLISEIPISYDVTPIMIVQLARAAVVVIPTLITISTGYGMFVELFRVPGTSELLHFKANRNLDLRKNKKYAYDYSVTRSMTTGKIYSVKEDMRKQHMMIEGATGAGKTSMAFLPGIANDFDRRVMNENALKQLTYSMLKNGKLEIVKDINDVEFNIKWFRPYNKKAKNELDRAAKLMQLCGVIVIAPTSSFGDDVYDLAKCRGLGHIINRIDPLLIDGQHKDGFIGFNPLYINPNLTGLDLKLEIISKSRIFSDVLQVLYEQGGSSDVYFSSLNRQFTSAICTMIMKATPILHKKFPAKYKKTQATPEDFQNIMNDFSLARDYFDVLTEYINEHPDERKDYINTLKLIARDLLGPGAKAMLDQSRGLVILINELLANPLIRDVLCAETSVDLDVALAESQITLVNYELALGERDSRGFGLFFLLSLQQAVFRRPKNNRPIHFLYIDEFPVLLHPSLEKAFTLYRQFNVPVCAALQAFSQFDKSSETKYMKQVLLSNASTQIIFGRAGVEEMELYEKLGGKVNTVLEQLSINENSITDDNPTISFSSRNTIQKDSQTNGRDIRFKDFGEASMITVNNGNPTDIFAVKLNFLSEKQKRGKQRKIFDWHKYYNQIKADNTLDDIQDEKPAINENVEEPIMFDSIKFNTNMIVHSKCDENDNYNNNIYENNYIVHTQPHFKRAKTDTKHNNNNNNCPDYINPKYNIKQDANLFNTVQKKALDNPYTASDEYLDIDFDLTNVLNSDTPKETANDNNENITTDELNKKLKDILGNIGDL